jgi:hypothetical protein
MAKNIRLIMFYQGVPFEGSTIKSYTPDANLSDGVLIAKQRGRVASIEDKGVLISSPKDAVLVPWNNVGSVSFAPNSEAEVAKPAKAK